MPKWTNRVCSCCGKEEQTTSTSLICNGCMHVQKNTGFVLSEKQKIEEWGYRLIGEPTVNNFNKRVYRLITPCNHEYEVVFNNLQTQIKKAKEKNLPAPCSICGSKSRTTNATNAVRK